MQANGASFSESGEVGGTCPCSTKRQAEGFSRKVLGWIKLSREPRASHFSQSAKEDSRFLKNFNMKSRSRSQSCGMSEVKILAKSAVATRRAKGKCATHSLRHAAPTALDESGVSIAALCCASR